MKKLVFIIALLFGCGNPCEDQLSQEAQDRILLIFELQLVTQGYIHWSDNVFFDVECGDYLADIVLEQ